MVDLILYFCTLLVKKYSEQILYRSHYSCGKYWFSSQCQQIFKLSLSKFQQKIYLSLIWGTIKLYKLCFYIECFSNGRFKVLAFRQSECDRSHFVGFNKSLVIKVYFQVNTSIYFQVNTSI